MCQALARVWLRGKARTQIKPRRGAGLAAHHHHASGDAFFFAAVCVACPSLSHSPSTPYTHSAMLQSLLTLRKALCRLPPAFSNGTQRPALPPLPTTATSIKKTCERATKGPKDHPGQNVPHTLPQPATHTLHRLWTAQDEGQERTTAAEEAPRRSTACLSPSVISSLLRRRPAADPRV